MTEWIDLWTKEDWYKEEKANSFNIVNNYLKTPPASILDIGCGFAFESRRFNHRYGSKLWLLDGDIASSPTTSREIRFGPVETMGFYNRLSDIKQALEQDNIHDYQLLDVNQYKIPSEQRFDLICSWFSCGFHYPVETYRDLVLAHSHENTAVIFDLRKKNLDQHPVDIIRILEEGEKHIKAVIKF